MGLNGEKLAKSLLETLKKYYLLKLYIYCGIKIIFPRISKVFEIHFFY